MIEFESASSKFSSISATKPSSVQIKVLGIGGAGCNILSRISSSFPARMESIAVNTDLRCLEKCKTKKRLQLGATITGGWGVGGDAEMGRRIALEEKEKIKQILQGANLICLVFGLGKGTGTGVSPVIGQLAKELGSLTMGFAILPFDFEGEKRVSLAKKSIQEMEKAVDALMIIPNDVLLGNPEKDLSLQEGFGRVDGIMGKAIHVLDNLLLHPGLIDIDFADFKAFLQKKGHVQMAIGRAKGQGAAKDAAKQAISSPLMERISLKKAKGVLFNILGGKNLSLSEVEKAALVIKEAVSPGSEIVFGVTIDENLSSEVSLAFIAVGEETISGAGRKRAEEPYQSELDLGVYEDNLDIPTFLRKRKN